MLGAIVFVLLAFRVPFSPDNSFEVVPMAQELVTMEEIQQTRQEVQPPPPPRPMIPIVVPNDEIIEDIDLDLDVSLELDEIVMDLPPPTAPSEEGEPEEPEIFAVVEQMPEMIGGLASLMQAVEYPIIARKQGIEGNVVVQVIVDEEGNPGDAKVVRSVSPLLDDVALEAVMAQKFKPGRQRGRAVKVSVAIPVKFRLSK